MSKNKKIGVYICHCGGNISDVVKVKDVAEKLKGLDDVTVSTDYVFMCSDAGQKLIVDDLNSGKVDKVVVAACSPALHELTFRKCMMRAGKNPYQFEHVNIREQDSWVHKSKPLEATEKAVLLTKAGIYKIKSQDELQSLNVKALQSVLIIGGGLAGMKAAEALAGKGLEALIVEKSSSLGGNLKNLDEVYTTQFRAQDILKKTIDKISQLEKIKIYTSCEVKSVEGYVGNFSVELSNEQKLNVGAIIIASGTQSYVPAANEYSYKSSPLVVTMPEFLQLYKSNFDNKKIKSLAFIHCVGSRQFEGQDAPQADGKVNEYCSRTCCTQTLHTINNVQSKYPDIQIYDIYRDIRTYGRFHETYYENASKNGALFFRFAEDSPPRIENGKIIVKDILTWNEEMEIEAELIVLSTGVMPSPITDLQKMLKLPVGQDRFLQEAHPKLRPVEVASNGIYLAGSCQAPMDILEASAAGIAAASKASILLGNGFIALDPYVAQVNASKCNGSGKCIEECSYAGAISINKETNKAEIVPALCKGCGACVAVCPNRAIDIAGWSLDQFDAMIDAFTEVTNA